MIILPHNHQVRGGKQFLKILLGGVKAIGGGIAWALYGNTDIFAVTSLAPDPLGTADSKPNWSVGLGTTLNGQGLAPSPGSKVNIIATDGATGEVHLPHSPDDGVTWNDYATGINGSLFWSQYFQIATDPAQRNTVFAVNDPTDRFHIPNSAKDALATAVQTASSIGWLDWATARSLFADWFADFGPVYVWISTDGGVTYMAVFLDYVGQLVPTRMMYSGGGTLKYLDASRGIFDGTHTLADWKASLCAMSLAYSTANGYGLNSSNYLNGVGYAGGTPPDLSQLILLNSGGGDHEVSQDGFQICDPTFFDDRDNWHYFFPFGRPYILAPLYNSSACYVVLVVGQSIGDTANNSHASPAQVDRAVIPYQLFDPTLNTFSAGTTFVYVYKILSDGTKTRRVLASTTDVYLGASDPTNPDTLFILGQAGSPPLYSYDWPTDTLTVVNAAVGTGGGYQNHLIVTTQGTLIIACTDGTFQRSTDGGATFSLIDPGFGAGGLALDEIGGVVGGAPGELIASNDNPSPTSFLYSIDDGLTWNQTAAIGAYSYALTLKAR